MQAWLSLFRHVPVSLALFLVFPQRQRPAHFPVTISSNMPEQQHNQCNQLSECRPFYLFFGV